MNKSKKVHEDIVSVSVESWEKFTFHLTPKIPTQI